MRVPLWKNTTVADGPALCSMHRGCGGATAAHATTQQATPFAVWASQSMGLLRQYCQGALKGPTPTWELRQWDIDFNIDMGGYA
jgi:hypothetical protein